MKQHQLLKGVKPPGPRQHAVRARYQFVSGYTIRLPIVFFLSGSPKAFWANHRVRIGGRSLPWLRPGARCPCGRRSSSYLAGGQRRWAVCSSLPALVTPFPLPARRLPRIFPIDPGRPGRLWLSGSAEAHALAHDGGIAAFHFLGAIPVAFQFGLASSPRLRPPAPALPPALTAAWALSSQERTLSSGCRG